MGLAETLTGHLPTWESTGEADAVIPEGIPEPYAQLVRDCLHRDPARRPTIEAIRARLLPTSPAARQQKMSESSPSAAVPATELCSSTPPALQKPDGEARPEQRSPNQRFAMPAILVAVIFLAIVVGVWLVNRPSGNGPATQATVEQKQAESAMSTTQKPAAQPPSTQAESQPNAGAISSQPAPANKTNSADRQGAVLRQVLPVVPEQAQSTITGTVRVDIAVAVDARGSVTQATLASAGPSHYFADRALEAARQWTFASPTRDGQPVPSQWKLRFEFRRAGIKALPQRTSPAS
jgi:TonB family protein